jgi:general secretion pathway protein N
MRVEGVAPRTWLLATLAGWAVVLWVLALLGMGGHVGTLPDDPTLLSRLPQLPPAPPERLGPLSQYADISARPLFSEDRLPQKFSLTTEGDANAAPSFDYVLTGVLITPMLKMAIVEPAAGGDSLRIKLGEASDAQPAYRLTSLSPRSAVFEGPDGQHPLDLRVFDGSGGETPTAVAQPPNDANGVMAVPPPRPAPKPVTQPGKPVPPAATSTDSPDASDAPNTEAQIEGIRKRIEERRAQLRQQSQNPAAPATNP